MKLSLFVVILNWVSRPFGDCFGIFCYLFILAFGLFLALLLALSYLVEDQENSPPVWVYVRALGKHFR